MFRCLNQHKMFHPDSLFNGLAESYDSWFDTKGKLIFQIELTAFHFIVKLLPKPWLEIGVGSGRFAQALSIKHGIDPSEKLLQLAENRGINVAQARGEDLPFADNSFGSVFIIVTLCFVKDPNQVLKEAYRILTNQGKLALGLIPADSPWGRFYRKKAAKGHRFYSAAKFYTTKEAENMLIAEGFQIEQCLSTLRQKPDSVQTLELPAQGCTPDAGLIIVLAQK